MAIRISDRQAVRAALRRIRAQFPATPEGRLMFAVVDKAVWDSLYRHTWYGESAVRYLEQDLSHAELCGVDPEWIRETLRAMQLLP